MTGVELPMFPLSTVLVPGAPLPLHVFEPRYRALMDVVMASDDHEFGVVLIERGSEVGGGDARFGLGTVARIVQADRFDDGRWAMLAVGTRRLEVQQWLADDPYPRAVVVERSDGTWDARCGDLLVEVERTVRRSLALATELGERGVPATVELDDEPRMRAWQLTAIAPIAVLDRQRLLGIDDPHERLGALVELVDDASAVLAQRMQGL